VSGFFRERGDAIELFVRLTPKSSADLIEGVAAGEGGRIHLIAKVRAVPEKGAANAALERLLAERLGVARSRVSVVSGATSRLKTVRVSGDPRTLAGMAPGLVACS
jgi:uncharacterized protein YggU (UPF0235/DUF167 family)